MKMPCPRCGSTNVLIDACARWDEAKATWVLADVHTCVTCGECEHEFDVPAMQVFTVWCRDADGTGTMHVASYTALDIDIAKDLAKIQCAEDWGLDTSLRDEQITVIGVAEGDVKVIEWNDDV